MNYKSVFDLISTNLRSLFLGFIPQAICYDLFMSSLNRDKIPSSESALIDISGGSNIGDVNQSVTELTSTELEQLCHSSDSASSSNLVQFKNFMNAFCLLLYCTDLQNVDLFYLVL